MSGWDPSVVYAAARRLLTGFLRGDAEERRTIILGLRPCQAEIAEVFVPDVVEAVVSGYERLWGNDPLWPTAPTETEVEIEIARAFDFRSTNPMPLFPNGYRAVAAFLQSDLPWVAWRFHSPQRAGGTRFDGVVLVGERFCWCPRPWKVLPERILPSRLRAVWGE